MATQRRRRRPATTPESRENQVISAAIDLAERQIQDGTASAQIITHYLKLGSTRELLEKERLRKENLLLEAKIANMQTAKNIERLYEEAIKAMRGYAGQDVEEPEYDDDY